MNALAAAFFSLAVVAAILPLHAQDQPEAVDVCALLSNPAAYHHKLVRVSGRVSRGFEDFTIRGESCDDAFPLWLEYGGPQPAEVVYCCAGEQAHPPNRKDPLWIDGIQTSLVRNRALRRFDSLLGETGEVHSTLIGRVFADGVYTSDSGEKVRVGYGHFGIFSLFVIERVLEVRRQ